MTDNNNTLSTQAVTQPVKKNKNKGPYVLGQTLGEGAFAKVKVATQIHTKEKTAIKILDKIRLFEDESDISRVKKEIHILKQLRHKNIIQLFEVMESKKCLYIVMELCEGGELFDYIVKKKQIPEYEACHLFQQIINGVEYLHEQNIIHRDLKPENLLLDINNNIKISDFGLSTFNERCSYLQTPCGTPSYAPPEMLRGERYKGTSSDVWSCGIILYAMLCGSLPFAESKEEIICQKILQHDYKIPSTISKQAADLLNHIMKVNPLERYDIDSIKRHPWFNIITPKLMPGLNINVHRIPVDEEILNMVEQYGFDKEICRMNILNNKYCPMTCVYYLCVRMHVRMGGQSVSDLNGKLFEEYINNKDNLIHANSNSNNNDNAVNGGVKVDEKGNSERGGGNSGSGGNSKINNNNNKDEIASIVVNSSSNNNKQKGSGDGNNMQQQQQQLNNNPSSQNIQNSFQKTRYSSSKSKSQKSKIIKLPSESKKYNNNNNNNNQPLITSSNSNNNNKILSSAIQIKQNPQTTKHKNSSNNLHLQKNNSFTKNNNNNNTTTTTNNNVYSINQTSLSTNANYQTIKTSSSKNNKHQQPQIRSHISAKHPSKKPTKETTIGSSMEISNILKKKIKEFSSSVANSTTKDPVNLLISSPKYPNQFPLTTTTTNANNTNMNITQSLKNGKKFQKNIINIDNINSIYTTNNNKDSHFSQSVAALNSNRNSFIASNSNNNNNNNINNSNNRSRAVNANVNNINASNMFGNININNNSTNSNCNSNSNKAQVNQTLSSSAQRESYKKNRNEAKENRHSNQHKSSPFPHDQFFIEKEDEDSLVIDDIKAVNVLAYISNRLVSSSFCGSFHLSPSQCTSIPFLKDDTTSSSVNQSTTTNNITNINTNVATTNTTTNINNNSNTINSNENSTFKNLVSIFNQKFKPFVIKPSNKDYLLDKDDNIRFSNGGNLYDYSTLITAKPNSNEIIDIINNTPNTNSSAVCHKRSVKPNILNPGKQYKNDTTLYDYNTQTAGASHYNKFLDISTNYDPGLDSRGESSVEKSMSIKSNELRNFSFSPETKFKGNSQKRLYTLNSSFNGNKSSSSLNKITNIGVISEDEEYKLGVKSKHKNYKKLNYYQNPEKVVTINLSMSSKNNSNNGSSSKNKNKKSK